MRPWVHSPVLQNSPAVFSSHCFFPIADCLDIYLPLDYVLYIPFVDFFLLWSLFDPLSRKIGFCLSASPFPHQQTNMHILPSQSQPVQCLCYHKHVNVIYTKPRGNVSFLAAYLFFLNLMLIFLFCFVFLTSQWCITSSLHAAILIV